MEDLLASAGEIIGTLILIVLLCGFPVLAIGSILYRFWYQMTVQRKAAEKLSAAMALSPLNDGGHPLRTWYGGSFKGRRFGLIPVTSTYHTYTNGRARTRVSYSLRVVLEVGVPEPLGVVAQRLPKSRGETAAFEEAFEVENGAALSGPAREALLAFVRKGNPTGFRRDLSFRASRGTRHLLLRDRATAPKGMLAEGVLTGANTLLVHDMPGPSGDPEPVRALLEELSPVAYSLETGEPAPFPPGWTDIQPESGWRKNFTLILVGFSLVGLPACACICALLYGFLTPM